MRIIVIGAGEVGYHIAERLSHEAHEIVVIERHPEVVRRVEETLRVRTIEADGSSPRALEAAGVRDAAMVIAVADVDEVNIVACAIAHQYGVATKIARVRDIELGEHPILAGGKVLGIDLLINPTQVVADEILRVIRTTGAAEVADFADGRVQLLGVKVGAPGAAREPAPPRPPLGPGVRALPRRRHRARRAPHRADGRHRAGRRGPRLRR